MLMGGGGGGGGAGVWRWEKREIIHLSLRCHHQNDSCIKMGSDFNVSLIVTDKLSHRPVSTNHWRRGTGAESTRGPSVYHPNALPLGQTGSRRYVVSTVLLVPSMA